MSRFVNVSGAGSELRWCEMFLQIRGEILAALLLTTILILELAFFLSNENEAVGIDLRDIERWESEHSSDTISTSELVS